MKLVDVRVYGGRNIYSHGAVVRMDVDLEKYVNTPTCDIQGFNEILLERLPGLAAHKCSKSYEGGFAERLEAGTYLAHVIEHIALELQKLLGYDLRFGKTRYLEKETIYYIVYSYENEIAGMEAGRLAFDITKSILNNTPMKISEIEDRIAAIQRLIQSQDLGPSTAAIIEEAKKLKIPYIRIGSNSLFQLGYGRFGRKIQATMTDHTSCIAVDIAGDKLLTKEVLKQLDLPVPRGETVKTAEDAVRAASLLGYPVVVKPNYGNQGKGVSLNLNKAAEVERGFLIARKFSQEVLVEEFIQGNHYRVTVVGDKVVAVAQRVAAHVIGDGKSTLRQLIEVENQNPLRGEEHEKPLTKIKIDEVMDLLLKKQDRCLEDIPKKGEQVFLRENDNLSTGGIALDVTDGIHPENKRVALAAARAVGLDIAGIDLTVKDIGIPIQACHGAVIEVNACPGIRMHHYPSQGMARNVAKEIVTYLFPSGRPCRIPIISVTGTNGKTTTTRMLGQMLKNSGYVVGMTTTGGVYVNDQPIIKGDTTGPKSAQTVLMDPRVEAAVLETARGGLVNRGLGYDLADVGIITNIQDDHLGIDGINTLEEMAYVKSLVVEAVQQKGWAVLNGDDPYTGQIKETVRCNLICFSNHHQNPFVLEQMNQGKPAVFIKDKQLCLYDGKTLHRLLPVKAIASAYGGLLKHNIENSMAAVAGAFGMGLPIKAMIKTLREFQTDAQTNPGRFNLFDLGKFRVVVDYGHNMDGYTCVLNGLSAMKKGRLVGVIGVPGDRTDLNILRMGELSGKHFDCLYIKEDQNLRNRKPGEVARLLKKGGLMAGIDEEDIKVISSEVKALETAMRNAHEDDLIVVFYEKLEPLVELIEAFMSEGADSKRVRPQKMGVSAVSTL